MKKNTNSIEKLFEKYNAMARYEPIPQWNDDYDIPDDDDDNADQTGAFVPNGASTPAQNFRPSKMKKPGFLNFLKFLKIF